jgi:hypothetical protein
MPFGADQQCEECEDFIEKLAKDRVNLTFFSKGISSTPPRHATSLTATGITCHDRRDVQTLAIKLAREAVAVSGYF